MHLERHTYFEMLISASSLLKPNAAYKKHLVYEVSGGSSDHHELRFESRGAVFSNKQLLMVGFKEVSVVKQEMRRKYPRV